MFFDYRELAIAAYASYIKTDSFAKYQVIPAPLWVELPPQIQDLWLNSVTSLGGLVNPSVLVSDKVESDQ